MPADSNAAPIARFLALALLALAAIAFMAAHMPPRVKLLGLFPVAIGIASGGAIAGLTQRLALSRRFAIGTACVLVPLSLAGYAAESYRSWRSTNEAAIVDHLLAQPGGRAVLDRVRSSERPIDPAEAELLAVYRDRMNPPVSRYLMERLKTLPVEVTMPWAAVVAAAELLSGALAGILTTAIVGRRPHKLAGQEIRP